MNLFFHSRHLESVPSKTGRGMLLRCSMIVVVWGVVGGGPGVKGKAVVIV